MSSLLIPLTDRSGRFAPLKCAALAAALAPALWIALSAVEGRLGSRPVMEAIHQMGLWAVRLLAMTLAVTPLRLATRWPKLLSIRRILGVSALAYAILHVGLYVYDQHFAALHIASEIVKRLYLTIGFIALMLLCLLGATSTDRMIARLGSRRWTRLHRAVYAIAALASVHFFMQSKLDVTQPTIMAGVFALLFGYRFFAARSGGDLSVPGVAALAFGAAWATALGEALWFALSAGAPLPLVLAANLDLSSTARPAWVVLTAGLVLLGARLSRPAFARRAPSVRRRALDDAKAPG